MQYIDIKGGGDMPVLGLGTWLLKGPQCARVVRDALDLGYRHIDTAEMYGNEAEIGAAIAASGIGRSDLFVTTKFWRDHHHARDVRRSAEASLRNLRTGYVDLLLIHWPSDTVPLEETLGEMARLIEEGKTLAIGVSNFPPALLERAIAASPVPLACDQVKFHVSHGQDALLAVARSHGVAVAAYTPLDRGSLVGNALIGEIAEVHGKSPAQVALRWLIQQDGVAAIPKASSRTNLAANLDIFDFALTAEEQARLSRST